MNKQALILKQTSAFVQKDFEIDYIPEDVTEEELLDFLNRYIYDLLDSDMGRLFYLMYRLDINEQKVYTALSPKADQPPNEMIAKLIFLREKQKAQSRIEYTIRNADDIGDGWNT